MTFIQEHFCSLEMFAINCFTNCAFLLNANSVHFQHGLVFLSSSEKFLVGMIKNVAHFCSFVARIAFVSSATDVQFLRVLEFLSIE